MIKQHKNLVFRNIYKRRKLCFIRMTGENIRFSNFIPLSNLRIEFKTDEETGTKHLYLSGIAHGYKTNLKHIKIRKSGTKKAVNRFKRQKDNGRIFQMWIDHAYINPFGTSTPSEKVIGHVEKYEYSDEGALFKVDINPDHPSQIHKAILRRDIDGISIGADVKKEDLFCSIDGKQMFSDNCSHFTGQKLNNGKIVEMEVDDYRLDELTATAKQADLEAKIKFSELNNNYDSSIMFSLNVYDDNNKLVEEGIKLKKSNLGESLKKIKKYDKDDRKMTQETSEDVQSENSTEMVSKDEFNQLVDTVSTIKQSVENSNNVLVEYLKEQKQKDADVLLSQKKEVVDKILSKSEEFGEDELLVFDYDQLVKLEKMIKSPILPDSSDRVNQTFGSAVVDNDDKRNKNITLSKEDIKAWVRLKMGFSPEAPKHIQAKVRARLEGTDYKDEKANMLFMEYLNKKEEGE